MNETTTLTATPGGLALLQEWQHRLGLDDWTISLHDNCHPDDMSLDDVAGDVTWQEVNRTANIEIMDGKFYGDRVLPFDYEKTLVHELLHLKTSFISDQVDPLQARIAHQLIEDLARALVDAKRCGAKQDISSVEGKRKVPDDSWLTPEVMEQYKKQREEFEKMRQDALNRIEKHEQTTNT